LNQAAWHGDPFAQPTDHLQHSPMKAATMKHSGRILVVLLAFLPLSYASSVQAEEGWISRIFSLQRDKEVKAVSLKAYGDECSSCHYAYPPGLLPEASWRKLLAPEALAKHFGENIEMKESLRAELLNYAVQNAADKATAKRSQKIMASLTNGAAPERITEITYIRRKHQEIPEKMIKGNPKVLALSQCDTCHTEAKTGNLDDDTVLIPGYGTWRW
jgi:Dihaem cytochrome c